MLAAANMVVLLSDGRGLIWTRVDGSDLFKGYCTNTGGNPALLPLALKMHDETTHKPIV